MNAVKTEKKGFTLIELLVVVAIIMVLLSLVFQALRVARESVKRVSCMNNLRQLGLAINSYASESNGFFPSRPTDLGGSTTPLICWDAKCAPYLNLTVSASGQNVKNTVFWCKSQSLTAFANRNRTYIMNAFVGTPKNDPYVTVGTYGIESLSDISDPTKLALLYETVPSIFLGSSVNVMWTSTISSVIDGQLSYLHSNGLNVLFADFHVEWKDRNHLMNNYHYKGCNW